MRKRLLYIWNESSPGGGRTSVLAEGELPFDVVVVSSHDDYSGEDNAYLDVLANVRENVPRKVIEGYIENDMKLHAEYLEEQGYSETPPQRDEVVHQAIDWSCTGIVQPKKEES